MAMMYIAVLVLSMMALGHCQTKVSVENTTYLEIDSMGKMFKGSKQMNITADKNKITFTLKMLEEYFNATAKARTEDFTNKTFTVTAPADVTSGIASKQVTSTSDASDALGGKLKMTIDVYTAGGNLTMDNEITTVMKGDVKVMFEISNYNFDSNEFLDLTFGVMGSADPEMMADDKTTDGMTYKLGGGGMVKLSKKVMVADAYHDIMPMMSNKMFTTRFNKTTSKITYSFVISLATVDVDEGDGNGPNSCPRVSSVGLLLWALLLVHRMLW